MMPLVKYVRWDVSAMFAALLVVIVFEMMGVFTDRYITITALVRAYIPDWMKAMILGWLWYHFMIQK